MFHGGATGLERCFLDSPTKFYVECTQTHVWGTPLRTEIWPFQSLVTRLARSLASPLARPSLARSPLACLLPRSPLRSPLARLLARSSLALRLLLRLSSLSHFRITFVERDPFWIYICRTGLRTVGAMSVFGIKNKHKNVTWGCRAGGREGAGARACPLAGGRQGLIAIF